MKKLLLAAILAASLSSFAKPTVSEPSTIEKTDGTKIEAVDVEFDLPSRKLSYKTSDDKRGKVKYKELKSVTSAKFQFRPFTEEKKIQHYFVKAETPTKTLVYVPYDNYAQQIGSSFVSAFEHVIVAVFDNDGKLLEKVNIRQGKSDENDKKRDSVIEMIKKHFPDCPKLLSEVVPMQDNPRDSDKLDVLHYFRKQPTTIECN